MCTILKTNKKDLFGFGYLFLFRRKLSLFIDNGSTGQVPHLYKQAGHHMNNLYILPHILI